MAGDTWANPQSG